MLASRRYGPQVLRGAEKAGFATLGRLPLAIRSVTRSGRKGRTWAYYVPPIIAAKERARERYFLRLGQRSHWYRRWRARDRGTGRACKAANDNDERAGLHRGTMSLTRA